LKLILSLWLNLLHGIQQERDKSLEKHLKDLRQHQYEVRHIACLHELQVFYRLH